MLPLSLALLTLAADPAGGHEAANPLYRDLRAAGLEVGPGVRAPLPAPAVPDGLDPAGQKSAVVKLIGADTSYAEFTRKSQVAPQLTRIRDVRPADPKAPARGVDVFFVAYGDFRATDDPKFLDRLATAGRGDDGNKGREVTAADLVKRKIPPPGNGEGYGNVEFDVLDKVRLTVTGRAVWSKTAESVVAAGEVDPRFAGDPQFPNEWRSLTKVGAGFRVGPPQPYAGAGFYLKVTKLAEPAGALFVEQHVVFAEPAGWFNGANLLTSKLPAVVQSNVRKMRREWATAAPAK